MANAALDQEAPLAIDLYDEAKNTVLELARRNGVSEGDVVARALGILWILDDEKRKGGRVLIEDEHGKQPTDVRHPIGTLAPSYRRLRRRHTRHGEPFLLARLHIDERLSGRMRVVHAIFNRPRSPTGNIASLSKRERGVLMPGHEPVRVWQFLKESRAKCHCIGSENGSCDLQHLTV